MLFLILQPLCHVTAREACAASQPVTGYNAAHVIQQITWPRWPWEQAFQGVVVRHVPGWALVHVEAVVPVLVPGPLAALVLHLKKQPVVQHAWHACNTWQPSCLSNNASPTGTQGNFSSTFCLGSPAVAHAM
jgi:hypothetical protein